MKKALIIGAIIIVIVLIIFGIKSCQPRTKVITTEAQEYSAFINANVEFTCTLLKDPTLASDTEGAKTLVKETYAKYKFPTTDDPKMLTILKKYEDNQEIIGIVKQNTKSCATGGDPIFYQPK